jgi:thiamine-phosphate pyrophosphorylase
MHSRGLYALLDTRWVAPGEEARAAARAACGGARWLQYRDKTGRPATTAHAIVTAVRKASDCAVIINDDIALARACGAAGVHLGQSDSGVAAARRHLGRQAIIGVTCHASLDLARAAQQAGASYVSFGRFFDSQTKPDAPGAAVELLTRARAALNIPVVAIGGITLDNGAALIAAGADYLAVAGAIFGQPDITDTCRRFTGLFGPPAR